MIIIVDKPARMTSHDVVYKIKRASKEKVGHTGTLDPMCTGVLPILIGHSTKLAPFLPSRKAYRAKILLGYTSDTQDITGELSDRVRTDVSLSELSETVSQFVGDIKQIPPMYSAVRKNGKHLYELARSGIEIDREPRDVTVYRLDVTGANEEKQEFDLEIECSAGTYVRTLCHDIGAALGCGAVMSELRRISAGGYGEADSLPLTHVLDCIERGQIKDIAISPEKAFSSLPRVTVPQNGERFYLNGGHVSATRFLIEDKFSKGLCSVYGSEGSFLGIGYLENGSIQQQWRAEE